MAATATTIPREETAIAEAGAAEDEDALARPLEPGRLPTTAGEEAKILLEVCPTGIRLLKVCSAGIRLLEVCPAEAQLRQKPGCIG